MNIDDILLVAREAARAGGLVTRNAFEQGFTLQTGSKASHNLVTDADLAAEQAIAKVIHEAFPDHAIMGEETFRADASAEELWIVDPLDGTNNFAHALDQWSVSIAYYHHGEAQCGIVLNPLREEWHEATRGGGSWFGRHLLTETVTSPALHRVSVSEAASLSESLVGVGFYYDRGPMMEATLRAIGDLFRTQVHGIRRFGSAALDLCMVGRGQFGGFFEYELSPWDFAAARLFVTEAGGRVTTCRNSALPIAKSSVLATNEKLHHEMHQIVSAHLPEDY